MYILLRDTEKENDRGIYLRTPYFDSEVERSLIELYYWGVAEGLVEFSVDYVNEEETEVIDLRYWIESKQNKVTIKKVHNILTELKDKILVSS